MYVLRDEEQAQRLDAWKWLADRHRAKPYIVPSEFGGVWRRFCKLFAIDLPIFTEMSTSELGFAIASHDKSNNWQRVHHSKRTFYAEPLWRCEPEYMIRWLESGRHVLDFHRVFSCKGCPPAELISPTGPVRPHDPCFEANVIVGAHIEEAVSKFLAEYWSKASAERIPGGSHIWLPRFNDSVPAPDLLVIRRRHHNYVEVKYRHSLLWHPDCEHYFQLDQQQAAAYARIAEAGYSAWVMIYTNPGVTGQPSGLFGQRVLELRYVDAGNRGGWPIRQFVQLATLEQFAPYLEAVIAPVKRRARSKSEPPDDDVVGTRKRLWSRYLALQGRRVTKLSFSTQHHFNPSEFGRWFSTNDWRGVPVGSVPDLRFRRALETAIAELKEVAQ